MYQSKPTRTIINLHFSEVVDLFRSLSKGRCAQILEHNFSYFSLYASYSVSDSSGSCVSHHRFKWSPQWCEGWVMRISLAVSCPSFSFALPASLAFPFTHTHSLLLTLGGRGLEHWVPSAHFSHSPLRVSATAPTTYTPSNSDKPLMCLTTGQYWKYVYFYMYHCLWFASGSLVALGSQPRLCVSVVLYTKVCIFFARVLTCTFPCSLPSL